MPGPDEFTGKCYKTKHFKEKIQVLHKLSQKTEKEEIFPNSLNEANIILIPKPDTDISKENYGEIPLINIDANL